MGVFCEVLLVVQLVVHALCSYIGNYVIRLIHTQQPKMSPPEPLGDKNDMVRETRDGCICLSAH